MNLSKKRYEAAHVYRSPFFIIKVHTNPLGKPSFHLIKPDEFEVVLAFDDLSVLEVKYDKKKRKKLTFSLTSKELMELEIIFKEVQKGDLENVWAQAVNIWNGLNPKNLVNKKEYKSIY